MDLLSIGIGFVIGVYRNEIYHYIDDYMNKDKKTKQTKTIEAIV